VPHRKRSACVQSVAAGPVELSWGRLGCQTSALGCGVVRRRPGLWVGGLSATDQVAKTAAQAVKGLRQAGERIIANVLDMKSVSSGMQNRGASPTMGQRRDARS